MRRLPSKSRGSRAIAGETASDASRAAAARIAEAQIDLVGSARLALTPMFFDGADVTREILRLDRYERRDRGRRE
jgi:hypothetical protein